MKFPEARILEIDLTQSSYQVKTLPGEVYRLYPGGSALGMYLLMQHVGPKIDPLGPENALIFSVSPLTGLPVSGQSRMVVTAKSPLTGGAGDSQAGGYIPAYIKGNGYDAIVFKGKAPRPVYVSIDGEAVRFHDAANVWGKTTAEAGQIMMEEIGSTRVEIAQIGPAGENLVKYASILNMNSRANGRNGMGAVMGSKNLRALVVAKTKAQKPYDSEMLKGLTRNVSKRIQENGAVQGLGINGTAGVLSGFNEAGYLPTRNWLKSSFEKADAIKGETLTEEILVGRESCFGCAIRCKRMVEVPGKVDPAYGGPEYETCATFGSYCEIDNLEEISYANQLCNMYGLDTISCGGTISFAMECFENGLLTEEETGGLPMKFGDSNVLGELIPKIAFREEGIGNLLAEGSARAAKAIGKGAEKFSISVKNQELPAHMPQNKQSIGLIYAVNPFGADHQSSEHDTLMMLPGDNLFKQRLNYLGCHEEYDSYDALDEGKVNFAFTTQRFLSALDTLCLCQFAFGPSWQLYGPQDLLTLCEAGLGWEATMEEILEIGERRINLMRSFNEREGFNASHDSLPERMFEAFEIGPSVGSKVERETFEWAKKRYYEMAGWDVDSGNPTGPTLERLDLSWVKEPIGIQ